MLPSPTFAANLHERLRAGDAVAPADLVAAYLPLVCRRLRELFPGVRDDMLLQDAACDALLGYAQSPARHDPTKLPLFDYLVMAARGDLLNALERVRGRHAREIALTDVAESVLARNDSREGEGTTALERQEEAAWRHQFLERVWETVTDPRDRAVVRLLWDGERKTAAYAAVLGIQDRPRSEQERIVKRSKDRLKKLLKRLGDRLRRGGDAHGPESD
jgi:RNA polymerase sigma factor (sigma-70 family)